MKIAPTEPRFDWVAEIPQIAWLMGLRRKLKITSNDVPYRYTYPYLACSDNEKGAQLTSNHFSWHLRFSMVVMCLIVTGTDDVPYRYTYAYLACSDNEKGAQLTSNHFSRHLRFSVILMMCLIVTMYLYLGLQ